MYRESSFWIIGIVPSIKNTESQFGEFRHWVWSPVLASMFEPISKCHFCKQSKWRRNFRRVLGGNKTGFRCNSCHSGQRARQDGDSGERSGKGARTTSISHKATDGGNQFYRICYPIASFIFVLLSFLGKVSHQWLPLPHLFFFFFCRVRVRWNQLQLIPRDLSSQDALLCILLPRKPRTFQFFCSPDSLAAIHISDFLFQSCTVRIVAFLYATVSACSMTVWIGKTFCYWSQSWDCSLCQDRA